MLRCVKWMGSRLPSPPLRVGNGHVMVMSLALFSWEVELGVSLHVLFVRQGGEEEGMDGTINVWPVEGQIQHVLTWECSPLPHQPLSRGCQPLP